MARVATRLSDAVSTVNLPSGTTPCEIIFSLKECLKLAGWIHRASGDGLGLVSNTVGNANDVITAFASGAGGLNNNNAWFIMREPVGPREVIFQRGTNDETWWIEYSPAVGYAGTGTITVGPPSPSDAVPVAGIRFSTGFTLFPTSDTWRGHVIAESTPVNGAYGWWLFTQSTVSPYSSITALLFEPLTDFGNAGCDPVAIYRFNGTGPLTRAELTASSLYWRGAVGYGDRQRPFAIAAFAWYTGSSVFMFPGGVQAYPYDAAPVEDGLPLLIGQAGSPYIMQGMSAHVRWKGTTKDYPDTIDLASAEAYVFINDLHVPWPTGVTPAT